jgi:hypothetical protein
MLLQNATNFASNPITLTGGTLAGESVYLGLRYQTFITFAGSVASHAAIPEGYTPGDAWFPAIKSGGAAASSRSALDSSGVLSGGLNAEASSAMELVGDASGALLAALQASGSISLSGSSDIFSIVIASLAASGSSFLDSASALSGLAFATGSSSFSLAGSAEQRANAFMDAAAGGPESLSPQGLANAVWNAVDSANNTPGTMGAKLNSAASAGDPWSTLIPGSYVPGSAGYLLSQLALENPDIAAQLQEVWGRLGLDSNNPLVNQADSIAFGDVEIVVTATSTSSTLTRA